MSKVKSITPLPPADFTTKLGNYNTLRPFRYWCQKVLPLVYDDTLSYYELLCKVVDYLNKTMEDVETLHGDVTSIYNTYIQLQEYVNNYFSTLDVQEEINNKLDDMAENGELYAIIKKYTDPIVNEQNDKIDVLKARMDTFASLPDGSTSGDAELTDIRVGYDGKKYPSAGDAVRGQVTELKGNIVDLNYYNLITYNSSVYSDVNNPTVAGTKVAFNAIHCDNLNVTSLILYGMYGSDNADGYDTLSILEFGETEIVTTKRDYHHFQVAINPINQAVTKVEFRYGVIKNNGLLKEVLLDNNNIPIATNIDKFNVSLEKEANTGKIIINTGNQSGRFIWMNNFYVEASGLKDTILTFNELNNFNGATFSIYFDYLKNTLTLIRIEDLTKNIKKIPYNYILLWSAFISSEWEIIEELFNINSLNKAKMFDLKVKQTFSILGDSYSTFGDYCNPQGAIYYPTTDPRSEGKNYNNDVLDVKQTWWYLFMKHYDLILNQNASWSGSPICYDGLGNGTTDAKTYSFVTRCKELIGSDYIIIEGGTNDSASGASMGEYKYSDFTESDFIYYRPSLSYVLNYLQTKFPSSKIIFMLNCDLREDVTTSTITICNYYNVPVLQLSNIEKIGGHPNVNGMTEIFNQLSSLLN